ncbi:N-acetylglucosamine-specific PTS transporter subunit IIBC [Clostridium sp.]|uniref:N-acetylglucosamine-specific PTS transporter subunit IIBC n=1 Tax=Clostridium sp. TaxID=1506 RepID=UPI0034641FA9
MAKGNKILASLQKLGKSLMTPIAVLPAAGLLLRLGQEDVFNILWMAEAGNAVFANLPIIFAIGIAVGFAEENNGVAGIAAAVGYFILTKVAVTFDSTINMGVLAGVIAGITAGILYNKFKDISVPQFLGFFGGKRFVPIITSLVCLILGFLAGGVWPFIQGALNSFGNWIVELGAIGSLIFGLLNRLLIPVGLHHVVNSIFWFEFGTFTNAAGELVKGDIARFFAGDPNAGNFMAGFYPIMMFALPAACFAMITTAKKEKRAAVAGMLGSLALTSFLTGITEPIEFSFMFLAPALYVVHSILTGVSLAVTTALGIKSGFTFSGGLIDYVLSYGKATKPLLLIGLGLIFAVIYYLVFVFMIRKFDLKTPGREDDEEDSSIVKGSESDKKSDLDAKAAAVLEAIGGKENIEVIDACITRLRLTVKDGSKVDEPALKKQGASGVMRLGENNVQVIMGTIADPMASKIKKLM